MSKPDPRKLPPVREPRPEPRSRPPFAPAALAVKSGVPHGATEIGWLPDLVYTGGKFEAGMAFFADAVGKITRFSREPADLAIARRLEGQAALPGLINAHSHSFQRVLRGRAAGGEGRGAAEAQALARLSDEDVFDAARMTFLEMLLSGTTCVGEFHYLHHRPDGTPWPDPNHLAREVIRAAHEVGIRIALLKTAYFRGERGGAEAPGRFRTGDADAFVRETEALRLAAEKEFPVDEAWLGVAAHSLAAGPIDQVKVLAAYARAQRLRLHVHAPATTAENEACRAETGRTPIALLAEHGVVDKRFTAVGAVHLTDDEIKVLGQARAMVCRCPTAEDAPGVESVAKLFTAGAGVALGTDGHGSVDLLKEARVFEFRCRTDVSGRSVLGPDPAAGWFHAATVAGARSLGATGGALEVGRPADFFTVNLFDPSLAGSDGDSLLANVLFAADRRAIRDVWIGGRQRSAGGRHPNQGPIVGRFVDLQRRIWSRG